MPTQPQSREWVPLLAILWLAVTVVALGMRPPLPVDETRYLAVAWDMWLEGHYLVPHLHGEPYSHKPPLLFWLMTAGWHLFGVNEWWPRLVAPLFGAGTLMLTVRLAALLWPDRGRTGALAPVLLFGAIFWTVFGTLTMFDMLLAFFAVVALIGLVRAAREPRLTGFAIAGAAMGFGVLAKGPAILLHVLPVALSAPWWLPRLVWAPAHFDRRRWYAGVGGAVLLAVAIGLAWAVPAGVAGGEAYRDAIFWGQSAERMVDSFAHARPVWWYAAVLPGLVLPWLIWPPLWRAARRAEGLAADGGIRLCLIWFGAAFIAFSAISGKQLHYLLPEFPALALIAAWMLTGADTPTRPSAQRVRAADRWISGGPAIVAGAAIMAAPNLPLPPRALETVAEIEPVWGILVVIAGVMTVVFPLTGPVRQALRMASMSAFVVLAVHLAARPLLAERYDLRPMAAQLSALEQDGKVIAYFGKYHGQFHFLGRLARPFVRVGVAHGDTAAFLRAHPDGVLLSRYEHVPRQAHPLFTYPFRGYTYAAWPAAAVIANPGLGERR